MERDKHVRAMEEFIEAVPTPELKSRLSSALYTANELHLWPDCVDSVSEEQAIRCWKIVERLRKKPFPEELEM